MELEKDTLADVIRLVPDLDFLAWILHHARTRKLKFPVRGGSGLKPLFGDRRVRFEGHLVTWRQVSGYLAKEYFPIDDEAKLLRIAQVALAARAHDIQRRAIGGSQKVRTRNHG